MIHQFEPFLRTHEYVATYLALTYFLSLSFLVFGKGNQGIFNSLFSFGLLMMGWTVIPSIVDSDNYWFLAAPPSFVSRFALVSIFSFVLIDSIKSKFALSKKFLQSAASVMFILLLTFLYGFLYVSNFDIRTWIAFSIIFGAGALIALYLIFRFGRPDHCEIFQPSVIVLLLVVSIVVGFFEIAGSPFVFNLFRGFSEARSASLFHNPNWFAIYISPLLFYSAYLTASDFGNRAFARSFLVVALVTLCLILSGSRSVVTIASIFVAAILVVAFSLGYFKIAQRLLLLFLCGGLSGIALGYLFSTIFGSVVLERYSLLIDRLFLWPFYFFDDLSAQQSLRGRFVVDSIQIIDSAYIFAFQDNTLLFIVLSGMLLFSVFQLIWSIFWRTDFTSILGNFLLVYLMTIGAIGQIFWAFPVWISVFVFLAFGIILSKDNFYWIHFRGSDRKLRARC